MIRVYHKIFTTILVYGGPSSLTKGYDPLFFPLFGEGEERIDAAHVSDIIVRTETDRTVSVHMAYSTILADIPTTWRFIKGLNIIFHYFILQIFSLFVYLIWSQFDVDFCNGFKWRQNNVDVHLHKYTLNIHLNVKL